MLRFGFALIWFVVSLVFTGISFFKGNVAYGVGFLLTALVVALIVAIWSDFDDLKSPAAGLSLITIIWVGVFLATHKGIDVHAEDAHQAAAEEFTRLPGNCKPYHPKVSDLASQGQMVCTVQGEMDNLKFVSEISKFHSGNAFAGASDILKGVDPAKIDDQCAELVKLAYEMCPEGGMYLQEKDKQILLSRAKL